MSAFLAGLIEAVFAAFFKSFFGARETAAARADLDQAHERAGAADAANETLDTISEIANERASLPTSPASPADLARRLRARADADRKAGSGVQDGGRDGG